MDKTPQEYQKMVEISSPNSKLGIELFKAFWVGGMICVIGEAISQFYQGPLGLMKDDAAAWVAITLVFIGATLTGIGVYDLIGKYAGAGSLVPITGFANSVVAPAMEFRREGLIMGVGAKIFMLAGPVIAYGVTASVIVGLISLLFSH